MAGTQAGSMTNFPQGFAFGVTVRGIPLLQAQPGQVFYVGNSTVLSNPQQHAGSDSNRGTFLDPFATLSYAVNTACLASRGDIVFVLPGHAETITAAAGINLTTAGVAIVGLGAGSLRPKFSYTTANTATMTLAANNLSFSNILFDAGFLNVAAALDIVNAQVATDLAIDNCEFRDRSTVLNFVKCLRIGTTANIADGLSFTNNRVLGKAATPAAGTTAVSTGSIIDRAVLANNFISHRILLANTACLIASGALDLTNTLMQRNVTDRPNTASNGELWSTTSTASIGTILCDNYCGTLSANGLVAPVSTTAQFINNYCMITGAQDKSALINPAAV